MWSIYKVYTLGDEDNYCSKSERVITRLLPLYNFDTQGLSPQSIKGYRSCLASVLSHKGMAAAVQAKTMSVMLMSMELQRPRMTPVLPQWDLDIILEALSKPPYVPLRETSLKHLTLKTVFLLAMALAGRCSELQALVLDLQYNYTIQT